MCIVDLLLPKVCALVRELKNTSDGICEPTSFPRLLAASTQLNVPLGKFDTFKGHRHGYQKNAFLITSLNLKVEDDNRDFKKKS